MKNFKVVYVEGLPGSGKTTLLERLPLVVRGLHTIGEYVDNVASDQAIKVDDEEYFLRNDERKYRAARAVGGLCLVDRGHLSTLLYNKAYERIKDQQQVDVDAWYHGIILAQGMLPDAYIHLDTLPDTSLRRRPRASWDNMWDYPEALALARQGYRDYLGTYESHVPVLRLDADALTIPQIDVQVTEFLDIAGVAA